MAPHQPFGFKHDLDLDLFALARLAPLARRAPDGAFTVQLGDEGRERSTGVGPTYTTLEGSLAAKRKSEKMSCTQRVPRV